MLRRNAGVFRASSVCMNPHIRSSGNSYLQYGHFENFGDQDFSNDSQWCRNLPGENTVMLGNVPGYESVMHQHSLSLPGENTVILDNVSEFEGMNQYSFGVYMKILQELPKLDFKIPLSKVDGVGGKGIENAKSLNPIKKSSNIEKIALIKSDVKPKKHLSVSSKAKLDGITKGAVLPQLVESKKILQDEHSKLAAIFLKQPHLSNPMYGFDYNADSPCLLSNLGAADYCKYLVTRYELGLIDDHEIKELLTQNVSWSSRGAYQALCEMLVSGEGGDDDVVKAVCSLLDRLDSSSALKLISCDGKAGRSIFQLLLEHDQRGSFPDWTNRDVQRGATRFLKLMDYVKGRMGSKACDEILSKIELPELFGRHLRLGNSWAIQILGCMIEKAPFKSFAAILSVDSLQAAIRNAKTGALEMICNKVIPLIHSKLDRSEKDLILENLRNAEFYSVKLSIYRSDFRTMKSEYKSGYDAYRSAKNLLEK